MALKTFSSLPRELRNSVMDVHFFFLYVCCLCLSQLMYIIVNMFVLLGKNLFKMLKNVSFY